MGPRAGVGAMEERKSSALTWSLTSIPRLPSPYPVTIPTELLVSLYGIL
jgi:hypothetical protein